ncbi:MAG: STAS domain-containing protein [Pseudomonadota bacterium]
MEDLLSDSGVGLNIIKRNLVVTLAAEPDDNYLFFCRKEILAALEASPVQGVLVDVSKVKIIDAALFGILAETARMVKLLGANTVLVGFRAGAASALADLDVDIEGIVTAVTMEDAMDLVKSSERKTFSLPGDDGPNSSHNA